jgi:hypothetical protein
MGWHRGRVVVRDSEVEGLLLVDEDGQSSLGLAQGGLAAPELREHRSHGGAERSRIVTLFELLLELKRALNILKRRVQLAAAAVVAGKGDTNPLTQGDTAREVPERGL